MLRQLLLARDPHCTQPFCSAPTRHADHIRPYAVGGDTTLPNGQGLCASGNYAKEIPGWKLRTTGDSFTVTTPTGHRYRTNRSDPLGLPAITTPV
ncbi:HNH endonuclease signature motif containing protein [Nakamurella aerolata]|uniref:HNH endonuclease n=1 Tax=Nakamurella aerolata TaxID=1656892 RepID=A0A849AAL4_9ACTN|nr:HNH endonuclease signature motif containing protein [Nakamurella aerolata]NNG36997.1 HNH endonuclease [Nakamurella aerolata]